MLRGLQFSIYMEAYREPGVYHSYSIIIHIASQDTFHLLASEHTATNTGPGVSGRFSPGKKEKKKARVLYQRQRPETEGEMEESEGGRRKKRRGVKHFISLSSLSPSQAFNAPFSACPALCKIMLIPFPVLSHLYKPPFLPLKSNYISLRSCQKTGLACEY